MKLAIVFPMFWGRTKEQVYLEGDQYYDHPTALDDEGTIPALFESFSVLDDRDFEIVAVAGANHPSMAEQVERAAANLLQTYAQRAGVKLHFFSYSHADRLRAALEDAGLGRLTEPISLLGYSPLRNACLLAAHLLGFDIVVSIDDDCVFVKPDYLRTIRDAMLSDFEGDPLTALCGPYLTERDEIYLPRPSMPHAAYWNVIDVMNEAFRQFIVDDPGRKEVPFAIMGNIAVHRDFFSRIPLDPPMRRGEDMDWVMNAHILGERFVMDTDLLIKHMPASRPYPTWRPMREDIYRFRYQQSKIAHSRQGDGTHKLDRNRYLPYPGRFYLDDFADRVTQACSILAMDYLSQGKTDDARESLENILHAHYDAIPKIDPFQKYLDFRELWEKLMQFVDQNRDELRQKVFA